jgi:very-short-patch-repair endonuclease
MNSKADFAILQEQLWYRIPVASAPRRWPPRWLAFYHTKAFGDLAYAIHYYGRVRAIRVVERRELFPHELPNPKSERKYYQVFLESLESLPEPIRSARWRRIVFISTTWDRFVRAKEVNDLFDESPLEDRLWVELKKQDIPAERQLFLPTQEGWFALDFALFCNEGNLDVETDGDRWHASVEAAARDYPRDNAVQAAGWRILRFNSQQIRESAADYCVPKITKMIKNLGGLSEEGLVPRQFFATPDGTVQQWTLFEGGVEYDLD